MKTFPPKMYFKISANSDYTQKIINSILNNKKAKKIVNLKIYKLRKCLFSPLKLFKTEIYH